MGLIQMLLLCVGVVALIGATIWVIGYLAPNHPNIIDRVLWVLAVLLIVAVIWTALGGHDYRIPRIF